MNQPVSVVLLLTLLTASVFSGGFFGSTSANPSSTTLPFSMPLEHVNYTITTIDGALWAKIDGEYPISIHTSPDCTFDGTMPMVYPMPPNTTNIHVYLDGAEVDWSNYTKAFPSELHKTAIGDWWMIYVPLTLPETFTLTIHYEHPLEVVNSTRYLFLYDLNIITYLSPEHPESSCVYTVRLEGNFSDLAVYTAKPDSVPSQWQPLNYTTTQDGDIQVVTIIQHSTYEEAVGAGLPGDMVVEFSAASAVPEFPVWILLVMLFVSLALGVGMFIWRRKG
ncbi:MAG: hypothetical protein NWE92_05420 [Candidatus Bathyarchaeota archaeon]|nr:hypothetical protein [Candidatus Bathyarchaeota archaeon]